MGSLKRKSPEKGYAVASTEEPKAGVAKTAVDAKPKAVPRKKAASEAASHVASVPDSQAANPASPPASPPAKRATAKSAGTAARKRKSSVVAPVQGPSKGGKAKLVRDSFTMPRDDFDLIGKLKERALGFKQSVKKSELLRAGLHALHGLSDDKLKAVLGGLTPLKAGRPKKQEA
jgi:hypothetical protein